ncbi:DUF2125 domain-containing protein [Roseovarius sp.]
MLRGLIGLMMVAALAWSGYWFFISSSLQQGFEDWFGDRRAEGWVADYGALGVQGFPNRIDTVIDDLDLADPDTGLAWSAPRFQINALSYRPNHVIAVWPNSQRLATPLEKFDIESSDMRASLVLAPDAQLQIDRTALTAETLVIRPLEGEGQTALRALRLAAEHVPIQNAATYRLGLAAEGLTPSLPWRKTVDPDGSLPESFDAVSADMTVEFDKPWDRSAIEVARPQPRQITLKLAEARWGRLELQAAGAVSVDAQGLPTGEITIKARNWREILQISVAAGAISPGLAGALEDGLSLLSQLSGNPNTLDIPLGFRNGRMMLGPVPIGPAPVLRLR